MNSENTDVEGVVSFDEFETQPLESTLYYFKDSLVQDEVTKKWIPTKTLTPVSASDIVARLEKLETANRL